MNNTENTDFALAITKEQLAELPRVEYPGHIHIIDSTAQTIKAVSILKNILCSVLTQNLNRLLKKALQFMFH